MRADFWTTSKVSQLLELVQSGLTKRVIAETMETSRNAVIGKLFRLGLRMPPAPKIRATDKPSASTPEKLTKPADLRPDQCRFPIGDPNKPGFGFCGIPRSPGKVYCAHHWAVTHYSRAPK